MAEKHMALSAGGVASESFNFSIVGLLMVFGLSMLVEWLSHTRFVKKVKNDIFAGLIQTAMYGVRTTMAYLVMLAVMSFNVGILIAAVAGYTTGFFIFGSRVFERSEKLASYQKPSDLPPLNC